METCISLITKDGIAIADIDLRIDVSDSGEIEAIEVWNGEFVSLSKNDLLYPIFKNALETQKADEIQEEAKNMFNEFFSAETMADYIRNLDVGD